MRVPLYENDQVRLRPTADGPLRGADPGSFGQDIGQSLQRGGQALGNLAELSQRVADQQAETRARTVDVEFSSHIRDALTGPDGLMNKQGQAFVDSAPDYLKGIEEKGAELRKGAKNAFEMELVDRQITQRLEAVRGQVASQGLREAQFANKATATARSANQETNTAVSYRDPKAYNRERAILDAAVTDQAQTQGIAEPAVLQAMKRERYNAVHTYAIQDMIRRGETAQAQAWMDDAMAKGELALPAATQLQERLEKTVTENEIGNLVEGTAPVTVVDGKMTTANPTLVAAVGWQESRNNGLAVSPKGAQGTMQVMPGTGPEAARLAGVAWEPGRMTSAKPEDVAYQTQLGTAYLNAQLKTFGGSVVVALAAYNAGPGKAAEWVKKFGDPAKGEISAREWASKIPFAETKDYVARITAKMGGTQKAPLPQGVMNVAEVEEWVKQFDDPKDRAQARAAGYAKVNVNRTAKSQREEAAWDAAQPYIQNDTPWTAIPKGVWQGLSPQHQTSLMEAQKRGTNRVTSPEALDGIYSLIERDPAAFKTMDLLPLAPDFSPSDFEQIRKMQHDAKANQGEWKKPIASYSMITRNMPTVAPPSLEHPSKKQERADFQNRWWQAVQAKQASQTEPLTDDEVVEIGTRLTADVAVNRGPFNAKTQPLYMFAPDVKKNEAKGYSSIPVAEQTQVYNFLKQRTGKNPSVGEVLDTWRTLKATGDL